MCVVLIAANAGAVLDHAASSDGLGMDDRHLCAGYSKLYTRGSGLTNSAADQAQMGFVTAAAYTGGGATGEWTVGSVTPGPDGTAIVLTGATFPAGVDMAGYRLRAYGGGATFYIPVRWSAIDSDETDKLVAWTVPGFLSPGDKVWVEEPGVILASFQEAASYANSSSTQSAWLAGFRLTTGAFGCPDDPTRITAVTGVVAITATGTGTVHARNSFYSEAGVARAFLQFGLIVGTINFTGTTLYCAASVIAGGSAGSVVADSIIFNECSIQQCSLFGGGKQFSLYGINSGILTIAPTALATIEVLRPITTWSPSVAVTPAYAFDQIFFRDIHNLRIVAEGSEPATPAVTLKAGQYVALFDHGAIGAPALTAGNGVQIEYDAVGTKFTPLTWASLRTTGFEIEGLQKVLCKMTGANYVEDMLPCPRGRVMQLPDNAPN